MDAYEVTIQYYKDMVVELQQELANVKHYTIEFLEMLDDQKNFCTKDIMIARAKLEQAIKEE